MYSTRDVDAIVAALIDLTGCLNSPRQDESLLRAAGVSLDRALFPLLVRLSAAAAAGVHMGVAQLADQVGRDPSTVSRQLAKMEELKLVRRPSGKEDLRVRAAVITASGRQCVDALTAARRKLLGELIGDWSAEDRHNFPTLLRRFTDAMKARQAGGVA
ncbi:MAG: MarR family transcriptional regulator [Pseudomonadota bacterium]